MRVLSVNVGMPQEVQWNGETVRTSIFKQPVTGPVAARNGNLDGDGQSDLKVHGGPFKEVYAYPSEHYAYWQDRYPSLPQTGWGLFGEYLTLAGLLEQDVCIGDILRIGTVELEVTQPRTPCFKLARRTGITDIVMEFTRALRPGFYYRIHRGGVLAAGDEVTLIRRLDGALSVAEVIDLVVNPSADPAIVERAASIPTLDPQLVRKIRARVAGVG